MSFSKHLEKITEVNGSVPIVFDFIDDHIKFSSHMSKSSWMMGGGKMTTEVDEGKGQKIGSHIKMGGNVLGMKMFLDEVVTERTPPTRKIWKTVGNPNLVIIGNYQMGVELDPDGKKTKLKVFIDYDLPSGSSKLLGIIFGGMYARWCVDQMLNGVINNFK